jgi:HPt (histidine-containing phosphotransfer) domain-containing protein
MTASTARAIDFNHLDSYTAGDQELIHEVLRLFKGQVGQLVGMLHSTTDAKTWRETAHGIKGAARGIGAWKAADCAAAVEKADFANTVARTAALSALTAAFADVAAEIEGELA